MNKQHRTMIRPINSNCGNTYSSITGSGLAIIIVILAVIAYSLYMSFNPAGDLDYLGGAVGATLISLIVTGLFER